MRACSIRIPAGEIVAGALRVGRTRGSLVETHVLGSRVAGAAAHAPVILVEIQPIGLAEHGIQRRVVRKRQVLPRRELHLSCRRVFCPAKEPLVVVDRSGRLDAHGGHGLRSPLLRRCLHGGKHRPFGICTRTPVHERGIKHGVDLAHHVDGRIALDFVDLAKLNCIARAPHIPTRELLMLGQLGNWRPHQGVAILYDLGCRLAIHQVFARVASSIRQEEAIGCTIRGDQLYLADEHGFFALVVGLLPFGRFALDHDNGIHRKLVAGERDRVLRGARYPLAHHIGVTAVSHVNHSYILLVATVGRCDVRGGHGHLYVCRRLHLLGDTVFICVGKGDVNRLHRHSACVYRAFDGIDDLGGRNRAHVHLRPRGKRPLRRANAHRHAVRAALESLRRHVLGFLGLVFFAPRHQKRAFNNLVAVLGRFVNFTVRRCSVLPLVGCFFGLFGFTRLSCLRLAFLLAGCILPLLVTLVRFGLRLSILHDLVFGSALLGYLLFRGCLLRCFLFRGCLLGSSLFRGCQLDRGLFLVFRSLDN